MVPLKGPSVIPSSDKPSTAESAILASFYPKAEEMTIKQLQEKSGYSYERVYTTLQSLNRKKFVSKKKMGKTLVYAIDRKTPPAQMAFIQYAISRRADFSVKHPKVMKALEELLDDTDIECAVVFGSYAKDEASKESDVDVLCISQDKNLEKNALPLRHKYNLRINPVGVGKTEFKKIREDNPYLWQELVDYGVVLNGYDLFHYLTYR